MGRKVVDNKQKPQILHTELVAESRLFKVESVHLRFSNGVERLYERMKNGGNGAVMLVPMLDEQTILLIREYCAGTDSYELGFPKGLIDPGENAFEAGNRELMEEVGYGARQLTPLKQVTLAPSHFGSQMDILLAQDLYPEWREGDEPEPLEVVPWALDQLDELMARSDFREARSICGLYLLQNWLNKKE